MQRTKIEIIRVCELREGDKFLYMGIWRIVKKIEGEQIIHNNINKGSNPGKFSTRQKNFVEVERCETQIQEE